MGEWLWRQSRGERYVFGLWQDFKTHAYYLRVERPDGTSDQERVADPDAARTLAGNLDVNGRFPSPPPPPEPEPEPKPAPRRFGRRSK
tara:strand:- start:13304 stop:13567 length:264 start_codon:yes stop_codon:yes gene_type:complete